MDTIEARVAAGIARCDERAPEGWRDVIVLDRLDISSGTDCIAGQLSTAFGRDFWLVLDADLPEKAVPLGLMRSGPYFLSYDEKIRTENQALTAEWRRQLGGES
jgi:hypothetical protein